LLLSLPFHETWYVRSKAGVKDWMSELFAAVQVSDDQIVCAPSLM
jgi:hypothetical protein